MPINTGAGCRIIPAKGWALERGFAKSNAADRGMPVEQEFSSVPSPRTKVHGAGCRIRTDDRLITNQVFKRGDFAFTE